MALNRLWIEIDFKNIGFDRIRPAIRTVLSLIRNTEHVKKYFRFPILWKEEFF